MTTALPALILEAMEEMSPEIAAEAEILKLIAVKDRGAFDKMVDLYAPMLYRYALRMCGEKSEAEDALQETFLTVQEKIHQFRGEGRLRNWLFKITGNACRQRQRKYTDRRHTELDVDEVMPSGDLVAEKSRSLWMEGPAERLLENEMMSRLETAIGKVPLPNRSVLILRDLEGMSTRETATAMEISEEAVKVRLHRARAFVRKELQKYLEGKS